VLGDICVCMSPLSRNLHRTELKQDIACSANRRCLTDLGQSPCSKPQNTSVTFFMLAHLEFNSAWHSVRLSTNKSNWLIIALNNLFKLENTTWMWNRREKQITLNLQRTTCFNKLSSTWSTRTLGGTRRYLKWYEKLKKKISDKH
jgi:hypothetical protein